eukprot:859470-Rhodomonas_salina.4
MSKQHLFASGENNLVSDSSRRWEFNHFANYDFFPSREFPILVYVKASPIAHKDNERLNVLRYSRGAAKKSAGGTVVIPVLSGAAGAFLPGLWRRGADGGGVSPAQVPEAVPQQDLGARNRTAVPNPCPNLYHSAGNDLGAPVQEKDLQELEHKRADASEPERNTLDTMGRTRNQFQHARGNRAA